MKTQPHRIIWIFALAYFAFYAPYSALTKAVTSGLFPGLPRGMSGYEILPATIAGTLLAVVIALTLLGWWPYVRGMTPAVVLSGFGTALIIGCTTLAYTFDGVSIVLALLLMRGGVLVIAPFIDLIFGRKVRWFSWTALAISIAALILSVASLGKGTLTIAAALNLGLYLSGYLIRLPCMTNCAKVDDVDCTRRWLAQELVVACGFLVAIPATLAMIGAGPVMLGLRRGFTTFSAALLPAFVIGVLYLCLYMFGTLIYLDRRENTFCVPLNRSSSLLAGIVAAYALSAITPAAPPSMTQLAAAMLIIFALLLLSPAHHLLEPKLKGATLVASPSRLILFVCSGNTCRSPMAAAIANAELALRVRGGFHAESAGLTPRHGQPMTEESHTALGALAIPIVHPHIARPLTAELVASADVIYAMTRSHRDAIRHLYPAAAAKTRCLDPLDEDVPDPIGQGPEAYAATAEKLRTLVRLRFDELGWA